MDVFLNMFSGIGLILFGIALLYYTYRNPNSTLSSIDTKGYIGGVGAVILGVLLLLGKIKW